MTFNNIPKMNWTEYFDVQVFEVIPCLHMKGWSYYRYHILPTKAFDTAHTKGKDLGMLQGQSCRLVLQLQPMEENHIASNLCWYGESMVPIEYIIYWLKGVLNGQPNLYYLGNTYFEYIDSYIYTVRMFYTVQAYLGDDLFKKIFIWSIIRMNPLVNRLIFKSRKNTGISTSVIDVKGTIDISGHILPSTTLTYDLGSSTQRWRDIYLSGNTIDLSGTKITRDVSSGGIKITDISGTTVGATFQDVSVNNLNVTGNIYQNGTLFTGGGGSQWTTTDSNIYYNTGNVGIGSDNPAFQLDVSGNINFKGGLYQNGIPYIGSQWMTSGSNVYYNTGNVGIGSNNPAYKLDVSGNSYFRGNTIITGNVGIGSNNPAFQLDVSGNVNFKGSLYQNGSPYIGSQWTSNGSNVYYNTGNVGIGSNNPAYKLDVSGNLNVLGNIYQNGSLFSGSKWTQVVSSSTANSLVIWGDMSSIPGFQSLTNIISIASGAGHYIALKADGGVVGTGNNSYGQINIPVGAQSGVIAVAAYDLHSLALKSNGSVIGWGNNYWGQISLPVEASSDVIAIATGARHSLALKNNGSVIGWGANYQNQITIPSDALSNIIAISAGEYYSLALKSNGQVIGWGDNTYGQINIPVDASSSIVAINAGQFHALAVNNAGRVIGWGLNGSGETTIPTEALSNVVAVSAGPYFSVALKNNGSVIVWGSNSYGQLNVPNNALSNIIAITTGYNFTIAISYISSSINNTYNTASNIGIGTSNPIQKLDVSGNSYFRGNVGIGSSNPAFQLDVSGNINFKGGLYQNGSPYIGSQWTTTGSNIYYSTGNVGIGNTNPQHKLHVTGDARIEGNIIVNGTQTIVDTNVATTERLDITNDGTGPALRITQTGTQPIVDFCDDTSNNIVFRIADGGNVGIGTTNPTQKLYVNGQIYATDNITAFSDIRFKTNIKKITNVVDKIKQINGYTFNKLDNNKTYMGVIAQEVQQVFPEIIEQQGDTLSVAYGNLVAPLIEVVKELVERIEVLENKLFKLFKLGDPQ